MSLDKSAFAPFLFALKKRDTLDVSQQERVFEKQPHSIKDLEQIPFSEFENTPLTTRINKSLDELINEQGDLGDDIYLTVASSQLYGFLMNVVKVPTLDSQSGESCVVRVCQFSLKEPLDYSKHRTVLNMLGMLSLDLDRPCVLMDNVFDHISRLHGDNLDIDVQHEFYCNCKRIVLEKFKNNVDVLSSSMQQKYKTAVRSILIYKSQNLTADDNAMMDNLQAHLIDQQLRFCIYLSLRPLLVGLYVRFNRQKNLVDATGNLFFRLNIPKDSIHDGPPPTLRDLVLNIIDFGFFVSYPNLVDRASFDRASSNPVGVKKGLEYTDRYKIAHYLGENVFYTILFRLMDKELVRHHQQIDDLVKQSSLDDLQKLLEKIIG